jgi:hypothetical protein
MRLTLARVRKVVHIAMEEHGIEGEVIDAKWIGQLSEPRFGPIRGKRFRIATAIIRSNGRTVKKLVTLEENAGWCVK